MALTDLTGQRFGRLVAMYELPSVKNKYGRNVRSWACFCDCGSEITTTHVELTRAQGVKSCGCLKRDILIERNKTILAKHNMTDTLTFNSWRSMLARVQPDYKHADCYFERGIGVEDERWFEFINFYKDMGDRPSKKMTLNRIDNNKGYCKENCEWSTKRDQVINRRRLKSNNSGRTGVLWDEDTCKWRVIINKESYKTTTVGVFDDFELACFVRQEAELKYYGYTKE